ncbi:MAG: ECF transporter S component, partial [Candidatus Bathyarchaeia archaeon]
LSVVGSFIHLPGPVQTVAFDSAPGFFAALLYGPLDGAAVCGLGHLATAIVNDAADGQQFFLDVAETTAWRLNYEVL